MLQRRTVYYTDEYKKCIKKLKLDDEVSLATEEMLLTFNFTSRTSDAKQIFDNNFFSIWSLRLPAPLKNRGKSGGYRLIIYFLKAENEIHMYYQEERKVLDKPKEKQKLNKIIDELKNLLFKSYKI